MRREQLLKIAKRKKIEVALRPEDFAGNTYLDTYDCPLARAAKRHFGYEHVSVGSVTFKIRDENFNELLSLDIVGHFGDDDHDFVREQYESDPGMKKHVYVVTLSPNAQNAVD
jgi:hypothetical protein